MIFIKVSVEPEPGVLVPVDYKSTPSENCALAKTLAHAHRIPALAHRASTLAYHSLRSNWRSICNG